MDSLHDLLPIELLSYAGVDRAGQTTLVTVHEQAPRTRWALAELTPSYHHAAQFSIGMRRFQNERSDRIRPLKKGAFDHTGGRTASMLSRRKGLPVSTQEPSAAPMEPRICTLHAPD